jgi:hypothetical protein
MAIQGADLADLVATVQKKYGKFKFTDLTSDLRRHVALSWMLKKDKVIFDGSYSYVWDIMVDNNDSARAVGYFSTDVVNDNDVMVQAEIPFRNYTWNYGLDLMMISDNMGPERIVDLVLVKRKAAAISLVELIETRVWRSPAADDNTHLYGIPYWVVKNNTVGFNGGAPTGHTLVAGLNPSTAAGGRWKNYTGQYTAVTEDDLIDKWAEAAEMTNFKSPVDDMPTFSTGEDYVYYVNWDTYAQLKKFLRTQNQDLGNDLDSMNNSVMFHKTKVICCAKLDEDTTNPVYGIDRGEMKFIGKKGWWMKETNIPIAPNQHTVTRTHFDLRGNLMTYNRRRHMVLATNTTMPS